HLALHSFPTRRSSDLISPCYPYRYQHDGETDEQYAQRLADELENKILALGPENVAAFVAETVVGATAGVLPPVATYFKRIREVCDRYGVLLILDEVMAGMGRTRSEEHTSELQSRFALVCRLLL